MNIHAARGVVAGIAGLVMLVPGTIPVWAAEGDVTVTGVVRLDGVPTAGIEVCDLFDHADCVLTDSGGTYTVTPKLTTDNQFGVDVEVRCVSVSATDTHEGLYKDIRYGEQCQVKIDAEPGDTVQRDLEVNSYPVASGQIVDVAGKPVAGATIKSGYRPVSLTDAQGRFSVRMGPYPYDEHSLHVSADGYESMGQKWSPDGNLGRIVLPRAGVTDQFSVSGRVVDVQGRPYAGVTVCIEAGPCIGTTKADGYYFGLFTRSSVSDAEKLQLKVPGKSAPVSITRDYLGFQSTLATHVDFELGSARRIVSVKPKIHGAAKVGARLTVRAGSWLPQPVATTCRWYVGSKVVKRNCSPLKVKASYRGKRIQVTVTGSRAGYASKTVASRRTARVR